MKKICFIFLIGLVLLLVGCQAKSVDTSGEPKVPLETQVDITGYFDNKDTFLLVFGLSTCSHCVEYRYGTLSDYIENETIPLHFIYSDEAFDSSEALNAFLSTHQMTYTYSPTTYLVLEGEVVAQLSGDLSQSQLDSFITTHE